VSAPASAPPPVPATDTCHLPSESWSQACKGGRPGVGASPVTAPCWAQVSATGTLLALATEKLGALAASRDYSDVTQVDRMGDLAPDLEPYL
jgi:hypothetical protein